MAMGITLHSQIYKRSRNETEEKRVSAIRKGAPCSVSYLGSKNKLTTCPRFAGDSAAPVLVPSLDCLGVEQSQLLRLHPLCLLACSRSKVCSWTCHSQISPSHPYSPVQSECQEGMEGANDMALVSAMCTGVYNASVVRRSGLHSPGQRVRLQLKLLAVDPLRTLRAGCRFAQRAP